MRGLIGTFFFLLLRSVEVAGNGNGEERVFGGYHLASVSIRGRLDKTRDEI